MLGYHFLKALAECKTQVRFEKANKEACLAFVTDEISKVQTLRDEGTKFGPMFADFILKYSLLSEFTSHYELTFDFDKAKKFTFTNIDESRVDRKSIQFVFFSTMHFYYRCRLSFAIKKLAFEYPDIFGRRSILKLMC